MPHDADLSQLSAEIDELIHRVEKIPEPAVRDDVIALLQSVLKLHAESFRAIVELLSKDGDAGRRTLEKLATDEWVSGVLMLHDLHPDAAEVRIQRAISRVNKTLNSQQIRSELLGLEEGGIARVRISGQVVGCMSSVSTAQKTIEDAVYEAAPEIARIDIENLVSGPSQADQLVQLELKSGVAISPLPL